VEKACDCSFKGAIDAKDMINPEVLGKVLLYMAYMRYHDTQEAVHTR
jgi:hypothetical protein